ncbi:YihY/virulence factor BrkB family protein [Methylonatrum kenyense]|uniref:YihY/virulence factor BrkB family protein n=1 Tax=Methylonatrum kenyense TaxID=455253 RepID=UPI0020C126B2|nr:YihY/virulence factor BrkB family protein [Methylonatrum kenyense]MCK8516219.1 YihY/virulence factor BrkB family protein [Methylonatrum kenyense]
MIRLPSLPDLESLPAPLRHLLAPVQNWFGILRRAVRLWLDCNAFSYAGSLAFYTLFSLAPTVIIAVAVMGLVMGEDAAQGRVVGQLQDTMGAEAAQAVETAVAESRFERSGVLPTVLGVGALLIGATTVFAQMQFSLNAIFGVAAKPSRNSMLIFIKNRALSLTVALSIGFVLLVSLVFGVALRAVVQFADEWIPIPGGLLTGSEFVISLFMVTLLFATIFKVLPDVVLSWRDVMLGALVTALLFAVGRTLIATYLTYTAPASAYGAAASLVLLLLWVYYSSLILLFGAAFTRVHMEARGKRMIPRNMAVCVRSQIIEEP